MVRTNSLHLNINNDLASVLFYDHEGVNGFRLIKETNNSTTISTYKFIKNELNDVISILDENGDEVISYQYDEWGNILSSSISDSSYSTLRDINPFRYRSYIYDYETGLYYLLSRYYDPFTHNFLTIDNYSYLDITSITGVNLYCYCHYNPIMYKDETGHFPIMTLVFATISSALIAASFEIGKQLMNNNWDWSGLNPWEIGSEALLGAASGFALAVGGVVGAAVYGSISLTAGAAAGLTAIAAIASFSAGIGGYSLHVAGVNENYNVGAAVLWGFGQLGKGATSYVSGFAFGVTGLWKMGSNSYTSNLGLHGKVGAYAKTIRDALLYRFPVRFAISYFPNLWLDEWFV